MSRSSHPSGSIDYDQMPVDDAIAALLRTLNFAGNRNKPVSDEDDDDLCDVHQQLLDSIEREDDTNRRSKLREMVTHANRMRDQILNVRRLHRGQRPSQQYYNTLIDALFKVRELTYDGEYRKAAITLGAVEAGAELLVLEVIVWGAEASHIGEYYNDSTKRNERRNERKDIRKEIASMLTNLTFGCGSAKRYLSEYDSFVPSVIQIIRHAPNLVPPFSNLLRNISWPSCKGMNSLFAATRPLAKAAIEATQRNDDKSIRASLSALWNIVGSGGDDCIRDVVDEDGCMETLIGLLTLDATKNTVVEYSTGILRYAATELVRADRINYTIEVRCHLISSLLPLLRASSLTTVKNALYALHVIAIKDPTTIARCMTSTAAVLLENLQRSTNDDIRKPAKDIVHKIGIGEGSISRSTQSTYNRDMSSSLRSDRLLPRRSPFFSSNGGGGTVSMHGAPAMMSSGIEGMIVPSSQSSSIPSSRIGSSLPPQFNHNIQSLSTSQYGYNNIMGSPSPLYGNMDTIRAAQQQQHCHQSISSEQSTPFYGIPPSSSSSQPPSFPSYIIPPSSSSSTRVVPPPSFPSTSFAPPPNTSNTVPPPTFPIATGGREAPPTHNQCEEGGMMMDDDSYVDDMSTQVTRAGSELSFGDENESQRDISGFHSTVETANNSARLSPVSYSELPDSPTQCAAIRDAQMMSTKLHLPSLPISSSSSGGGGSSGLSSSQTNSSHTTPHALSAEQTPTFLTHHTMNYDTPTTVVPSSRLINYGSPSTSTGISCASTPKVRNGKTIDEDEDDYGIYYGGEELLDRSIEEALPKRRIVKNDSDRMLMDSIASALPPHRPSSSNGYSNSSTIREDDLLSSAIQSAMPQGVAPFGCLSNSAHNGSITSKNEMVRCVDTSTHTEGLSNDVDSDESDDDINESIVGIVPGDVDEEVEAETIDIDCSSMKRIPRPQRSSHLPRQSFTRQATPPSSSTNGRPSPRPSSIGRPHPLTSTPVGSKSKLTKFPSTPRVSAVALQPCTPNGNETTPTSSIQTPPIQTTPISSLSKIRKPTASAVVPPYNYQKPKTKDDRKSESPSKDDKKLEETNKMLVTTV